MHARTAPMAAPRAASGASSSASRGSFGSPTIATHELLLSSLPVLSPGSCLGMQGGGRDGATLWRDSPVPVVQSISQLHHSPQA